MSEPQITHRPLATLTPWPRNARTHSTKQIRQIAASIRQFGFTVPVLIDEAGTILAGHGCVAAATLLGLTEVPCLQDRALERGPEARLCPRRQQTGTQCGLG